MITIILTLKKLRTFVVSLRRTENQVCLLLRLFLKQAYGSWTGGLDSHVAHEEGSWEKTHHNFADHRIAQVSNDSQASHITKLHEVLKYNIFWKHPHTVLSFS